MRSARCAPCEANIHGPTELLTRMAQKTRPRRESGDSRCQDLASKASVHDVCFGIEHKSPGTWRVLVCLRRGCHNQCGMEVDNTEIQCDTKKTILLATRLIHQATTGYAVCSRVSFTALVLESSKIFETTSAGATIDPPRKTRPQVVLKFLRSWLPLRLQWPCLDQCPGCAASEEGTSMNPVACISTVAKNSASSCSLLPVPSKS